MTKEELIAMLNRLPPGTEIYVQHGQDAYPADLQVFKEGGRDITAYVVIDTSRIDEHRNFPGASSSVEDITDKYR